MRRSSRANKGQHPKRNFDDTREDGDVYCTPCGTTQQNYDEDTDSGGTFIQCDQCNTWQHAACMGFGKKIPDKYRCNVCDPKRRREDKGGGDHEKSEYKEKRVSEHKGEGKDERDGKGVSEGVCNPLSVLKRKLKTDSRVSTARAFLGYFEKSLEQKMPEKKASAVEWAMAIEALIFAQHPTQYIEESRRILFLLKKYFMDDVLAGNLTFEQLLQKTPKEINQDIERVEAKVRKDIKNIILKPNEAQDIIRRSHRGDEVRENENTEEAFIDVASRSVDHRRFANEPDENPDETSDGKYTITDGKTYTNLNPGVFEENEEDKEYKEDKEKIDDDEFDKILGKDVPKNDLDNPGPWNTNTEKATGDATTNTTRAIGDGNTRGIGDRNTTRAITRVIDTSGTDTSGTDTPPFWHGRITFPDFVSFNASAALYSSTDPRKHHGQVVADIFHPQSYLIEGKFDRARADEYLDKITASRHLYAVRIHSTDPQFHTLLDYLHNRVGVLSGRPSFVKDSYLMALDFTRPSLPSYMKMLRGAPEKGMYAVFTVKKDYEPRPSPTNGKSDLAAIMKNLN